MTSTSSDYTSSCDMKVDDFSTDEAPQIETDNADNVLIHSSMPLVCTNPAQLLQVLQGERNFWEMCPTPIPADILSTFAWNSFNIVRLHVLKVKIDKHVGNSPTVTFLEQIANRLQHPLLPSLDHIDINWGQVVDHRLAKVFSSASVQGISISLEPIPEHRACILQQQVHDALKEVSKAFINLRRISITLHPDTWLSLAPSIASDRFRTIKHASFALPMGNLARLVQLIDSISQGLPLLLKLELTDVATRVEPERMTFQAIGPLLRCRQLQVVHLRLQFGFSLPPKAWWSMAFAWPDLTHFTVQCLTHARFAVKPADVGTWSSLEAIAKAPFRNLKSIHIPLELSKTDPPLPKLFHCDLAKISIESIGIINAGHVEAASRFLASLASSASTLRLHGESNEATMIRDRVKALVKPRIGPLKNIVSEVQYLPAPEPDHTRTQVHNLRVSEFADRLPVIWARPSPGLRQSNLGTATGLGDFRTDCDAYWFHLLSGYPPSHNNRFHTLPWQMIIGAMAVGFDEASSVDLWLPHSAWEAGLDMNYLAFILGSTHRKERVKIGIIDNQISQRLQDAFNFALATFNNPMPVLPCSKLVLFFMSASFTD